MSDLPATAAKSHLAACHMCLKLASADVHQCPRCGSAMHLRKHDSLQRTLALLITACLLYIPANLYPIMYTDSLGSAEASTIMGGVVLLINLGSAPVALVIFIFSVMVPSAKLMAMFYLVWSVQRQSPIDRRKRSTLYRITEFVGKWSMVDIFVVTILVALVQLGGLLTIQPGIAALLFAGVVTITMIAAENFDSRLIWDNMEEENSAN
ncbi:MAG: paraquat-inducible protein A [Halioglobus sp.]